MEDSLKSMEPKDTPVSRDGTPRKAYAPPSMSWEQPFEIRANLASACNKVDGQNFQCTQGPTS